MTTTVAIEVCAIAHSFESLFLYFWVSSIQYIQHIDITPLRFITLTIEVCNIIFPVLFCSV